MAPRCCCDATATKTIATAWTDHSPFTDNPTDTTIVLLLPRQLPAVSNLRRQGFAVDEYDPSVSPLPEGFCDVLLLNLMPIKPVTEEDIARSLCMTGRNVRLVPITLDGQRFKHTPQTYIDRYYLPFTQAADLHPAGVIVTGAPLEQMPFEEVRYWEQLCHFMDWADTHTRSTLYICWAAQAALYHFYHVDKVALTAKCFGIFPQELIPVTPLPERTALHAGTGAGEIVTPRCHNLLRNLPRPFYMPHSRHTGLLTHDLLAHGDEGLVVLAHGEECGPSLCASRDARRVFISGHLEYEPFTLHNEYQRDLTRGLPIAPPLHYYKKDGQPDYRWKASCAAFYDNYLSLLE